MKVKTRMRLLSVSLLLFAALFCVFYAPSARAEAQTSPQTEELYLERGGKKLYGKLYLPEDAVSPLPLVILSHGLGSNHHIMEPYAEFFSDSGIAAFVFDYIGGSEESLSDGNMKDMSVLAEAADILGAELIVVEGAGHGFTGGDMEQVARRSVDFVRDVLSAQSFSAAA